MERVERSPDAYIAGLEPDIRATMEQLDDLIRAALPGRSRVLWEGVFWGGTEQSIIGYRDIVQQRSKGADVEWFLIGLARQKDYFSLYVNAAEDGQYLGKAYADRLGDVKIGSASIGIRDLDAVDLEALSDLIEHADRIT